MNRIKQLREEKNMKQKELAGLLNCADNAVSYYESGQRGLSIELIADLCGIFGVTADYLLGLSSQRGRRPGGCLSRRAGIRAPGDRCAPGALQRARKQKRGGRVIPFRRG